MCALNLLAPKSIVERNSQVVAKDEAMLDDYEWLSRSSLRVDWEWMSSPFVYSSIVEVEYQRAEPDVGVSSGCNIYGDLPCEIKYEIEQIALQKWSDDRDDYEEMWED